MLLRPAPILDASYAASLLSALRRISSGTAVLSLAERSSQDSSSTPAVQLNTASNTTFNMHSGRHRRRRRRPERPNRGPGVRSGCPAQILAQLFFYALILAVVYQTQPPDAKTTRTHASRQPYARIRRPEDHTMHGIVSKTSAQRSVSPSVWFAVSRLHSLAETLRRTHHRLPFR